MILIRFMSARKKIWSERVGRSVHAGEKFPEFPRHRTCLRNLPVCRKDVPEELTPRMVEILNDLNLVVAPFGEKKVLGKVLLITSVNHSIVAQAISFQTRPFSAEFIEYVAPPAGTPLPWVLQMPIDEQGELQIERECSLALRLARQAEGFSYAQCVLSAPASSMTFDKPQVTELVPLDLEKMREQHRANRQLRSAMRALKLAKDPVRRRAKGDGKGRGRGAPGRGTVGRGGARGRGRARSAEPAAASDSGVPAAVASEHEDISATS